MNLAFIKKEINGVIYSRVELTSLGHLDFAKTLERTDESVEDFFTHGVLPDHSQYG